MMMNPTLEIIDKLETITAAMDEPNEFIRDMMHEHPESGTTRLYFQNLNGLRWDNQGGKWPYVCEVMASIQADIA